MLILYCNNTLVLVLFHGLLKLFNAKNVDGLLICQTNMGSSFAVLLSDKFSERSLQNYREIVHNSVRYKQLCLISITSTRVEHCAPCCVHRVQCTSSFRDLTVFRVSTSFHR